jgi:hypothetical protein
MHTMSLVWHLGLHIVAYPGNINHQSGGGCNTFGMGPGVPCVTPQAMDIYHCCQLFDDENLHLE